MAGVPDNFNNSTIVIGPGKMYVDLVVPGHNGRLILEDGAPSLSQNPDAKHVGYTRSGTRVTANVSLERFFGDESEFPLITRKQQETVAIAGELLQPADMDLLEILMASGTRTTIPGIDGMHFGSAGNQLNSTSLAIVAPLEEDPTRYWVAQLYKAVNEAGIDLQVTRTALGGIPFSFVGEQISTRPAGDRLGIIFKQDVIGS